MTIRRNFEIGRQSEQFLNEELITLFEALKYVPYDKVQHEQEMPPGAQVKGALNVQPSEEALYYWDNHDWTPFFKSKFQIIDQMLLETCPSTPVVGQLWLNNGVLYYFDGMDWHPVKTIEADDNQWASGAFADFEIVSPLNPVGQQTIDVDEAELRASGTYVTGQYARYYYQNELDYENKDSTLASDTKWYPGWESPELEEPTPITLDATRKSQFLIPNLKTDRVFLDNGFSLSYEKVSSVCFQYPTVDVLGKTVTGVHVNPGKLTGLTKRLIKVDKLNATIAVPPYNTEFYGFRNGEPGGDFLVPSTSQDHGDYVPAGDHIILNYHTNQNYDYVLAITYTFTWIKADGTMSRHKPSDISNTFYLTNLRDPVNVHANGFKLEEASYNVDLTNKTVQIDGGAENVTVQMWSPYKKQFGYIRETDLENRGIIRLHEPVHVPLVFVGGLLIHPLYGGLEFNGDKIYVPNPGNLNQMQNMQWCVVDLISDDYEEQYSQSGHVEETMAWFQNGPQDYLDANNNYFMAGNLSAQAENGIYDYILSSGTLHGTSGVVIRYDINKIRPNDGILLFIDGLLIDEQNIVRNAAEGVITIVGGLTEEQEYVLLRDTEGAIYNSATMMPALNTGLLSDSLIYLNDKLLCNTNCVTTLKPPAEIKDLVTDHEIKYFIENEMTGAGSWKIFDQFTDTWKNLTAAEQNNVLTIVSSYENSLTAVRINIPYTNDDLVTIYSFHFANALAGLTEVGQATWIRDDEDGVPLYTLGTVHYGYNQGMLNLYRNGVKMLPGRDYEETAQGKWVRILDDVEETDHISYVVEPVERGHDKGHTFVLLDRHDTIQPNIYRIPDNDDTTLYPGRLTVYLNGVRLPNTDWTLLDSKTVMLKYTDYKTVGSAFNYPDEDLVDDTYQSFTVHHANDDQILVEIRYDYDRQEKTVTVPDNLDELSVEDAGLDRKILESKDEVLFYLNGQFAGLSRNKDNDYRLDPYKGCIAFMDDRLLEAATQDTLKTFFDTDNDAYVAWKKRTGNTTYAPSRKNTLTIVWR